MNSSSLHSPGRAHACSSSPPGMQSVWLSHVQENGMQRPVGQANSLGAHLCLSINITHANLTRHKQ